jgi:simple sugar transport system ATP-binding protein
VLSGGNLQKVVLAREFSGSPRVVVAASPTQGLDVGATETVRAHLRAAADDGAGVLVFSEDLDEIVELADRILVIYEGAIVGEVPVEKADIHELGLLMAGGDGPARN